MAKGNRGTQNMAYAVAKATETEEQKSTRYCDGSYWNSTPSYGARAVEAANKRLKEELAERRKARSLRRRKPAVAAKPSVAGDLRIATKANGAGLVDRRQRTTNTNQQAKATAEPRRLGRVATDPRGCQVVRAAERAAGKRGVGEGPVGIKKPKEKASKASRFTMLMDLVNGDK